MSSSLPPLSPSSLQRPFLAPEWQGEPLSPEGSENGSFWQNGTSPFYPLQSFTEGVPQSDGSLCFYATSNAFPFWFFGLNRLENVPFVVLKAEQNENEALIRWLKDFQIDANPYVCFHQEGFWLYGCDERQMPRSFYRLLTILKNEVDWANQNKIDNLVPPSETLKNLT